MHIGMVAFAVLAALALIGLGYALRGKIRKEIGVASADATNFAARLEVAVMAGGDKLKAEAAAVASDIRKAVSKL